MGGGIETGGGGCLITGAIGFLTSSYSSSLSSNAIFLTVFLAIIGFPIKASLLNPPS
jgi:hypothetical protein